MGYLFYRQTSSANSLIAPEIHAAFVISVIRSVLPNSLRSAFFLAFFRAAISFLISAFFCSFMVHLYLEALAGFEPAYLD